MGHTKRLWRIAGLSGLLATLLLLAGLAYGAKTVLVPQGAEPPSRAPEAEGTSSNPDKLQILALGDSLTKGVGDDKGEGYVGRIKRDLEAATGKAVYVWNFAVNGATSAELLADVSKPSAADYISQADIIVFTIGGNDLTRAAVRQTASGMEELDFDFEVLERLLPESTTNLQAIMDKLSTINPKAQIIYTGLYHPFAEFDPDRKAASWLGRWNEMAFQAANRHEGITVVPTYDLFQNHWDKLLYTDHFHPNTEAYELIAARVSQAIRTEVRP